MATTSSWPAAERSSADLISWRALKPGEPFLVRDAIMIKDPVEFFGPEGLWARP